MSNRLWTKDYIAVCLTTFLMFLNYYYLLVTIPIYLIQDLEGNTAQAGLLVAVFYVSAILIRFVAGRWIESYGIKKVFLTSLIIYLGAAFMYFLTHSLMSLLILRVIHGIGFGMLTTATGTIVATIIPNSRKGEGMGYYGLMMNISMALGPFVGLLTMNQWGSVVMFAVSVISVLIGTFTALLISLPKQEKIKATNRRKKELRSRILSRCLLYVFHSLAFILLLSIHPLFHLYLCMQRNDN